MSGKCVCVCEEVTGSADLQSNAHLPSDCNAPHLKRNRASLVSLSVSALRCAIADNAKPNNQGAAAQFCVGELKVEMEALATVSQIEMLNDWQRQLAHQFFTPFHKQERKRWWNL